MFELAHEEVRFTSDLYKFLQHIESSTDEDPDDFFDEKNYLE